MKKIKLWLILTAFLMALCACGPGNLPSPIVRETPSPGDNTQSPTTPTPAPSAEPTPEPTAEPAPAESGNGGVMGIVIAIIAVVAAAAGGGYYYMTQKKKKDGAEAKK